MRPTEWREVRCARKSSLCGGLLILLIGSTKGIKNVLGDVVTANTSCYTDRFDAMQSNYCLIERVTQWYLMFWELLRVEEGKDSGRFDSLLSPRL